MCRLAVFEGVFARRALSMLLLRQASRPLPRLPEEASRREGPRLTKINAKTLPHNQSTRHKAKSVNSLCHKNVTGFSCSRPR